MRIEHFVPSSFLPGNEFDTRRGAKDLQPRDVKADCNQGRAWNQIENFDCLDVAR
jgi:hypothetical protein